MDGAFFLPRGSKSRPQHLVGPWTKKTMRLRSSRNRTKLRRELRPDLGDAVLEDRVVPASSFSVPPVVLTTNGYVVISTPPAFVAWFGYSLGGPGSGAGVGGNGGAISTGFAVMGFGMSVIVAGNSTGFSIGGPAPGLAGVPGISLSILTGSGANEFSAPTPAVTRFTFGQGGASSGTNFIYIGAQVPSVSATITPAESTNRLPALPPMPTPRTQPSTSVPALSGRIPQQPGVVPSLTGTVPLLPGTVPTIATGQVQPRGGN